MAKIIAAHLCRSALDILEVDGQQIGKDDVGPLADFIQAAPWGDGWRALIINEADQMTRPAQVSLLTVLERLGARSVVVFTSNVADDFEPRFLSRLHAVPFSNQGVTPAGVDLLLRIAAEQGIALEAKDAARRMKGSNIRSAIQSLEVDLLLADPQPEVISCSA